MCARTRYYIIVVYCYTVCFFIESSILGIILAHQFIVYRMMSLFCWGFKKMGNNEKRLLILGAGQYGMLAMEVAEAIGEYAEIAFLDDKSPKAIGKISELENYACDYTHAFVAIGNSEVRLSLIEKVAEHIAITSLVHPKAYLSPSARLGDGCILEPFAAVQTEATLGKGCIVSTGAVVNHNATVGDGVHIDSGAIIGARANVEYGIRIPYRGVVVED